MNKYVNHENKSDIVFGIVTITLRSLSQNNKFIVIWFIDFTMYVIGIALTNEIFNLIKLLLSFFPTIICCWYPIVCYLFSFVENILTYEWFAVQSVLQMMRLMVCQHTFL